jgi:putative exporter of polyketide antibiotics
MKIFRAHTLLIAVVLITILHFILTSIAGHYIAIQIGSSTGRAVAEGLIEATESPKSSEKEVNETYQTMKNKSNEVISRWKIPLLLISLPIKPVIHPLLNKIRKVWIYEQVLSKKISKDQFKTRGIIIENIANGLNSLTFGLLIYLAYRIIFKGRRTAKGTD